MRAELFGAEQLARHAAALAAKHEITLGRASNRLLAQLDRNEKTLRDFNRAALADQTGRVIPAAEWLLDNFYLIEEQIQLARRHLPREYSRELPCLTNGNSGGRLRVYEIVLELISHVDAQIDASSLAGFIAAYQTVVPLKLGELWAVPIMLRLGLIENLQRVTSGLTQGRLDRNEANEWVERLQEVAENNPSRVVIVVADMARADLRLSSAFVAEFCQRLSRLNPVLHLARSWLEQQLVERGFSIEQLIHQESQNQASDQVSVSHSIASLRALSAIDWKDFVESLSRVEQTLRAEPAGIYPQMDFATRDRYRHAVETLARRAKLGETAMAEKAVALAAESGRAKGLDHRTAHVGYFLVDKGRPQLERVTNVRWPWRTAAERTIRRFPFVYYGGGILLLSSGAIWLFSQRAQRHGVAGWTLLLCTLVFFLGVSQLAVALVNWLTTLIVRPQLLPRLDYSRGLAPGSCSIVVVPTILASAAGLDELLESLEIHQLANRDERLHFALLTDFSDALAETLPEDEPLLARAREGIETLNQRYAPESGNRFFLFHRPRRWNASEGVWMGYERKRGKLMEFNAYLRGHCAECFSLVVGATAILPEIRYVITLDTDTQLPRESARQLIGTMAHPLNRPVFNARGIVSEGYSLLQPRVDVNLANAGRSWFARLHAGETGIDPYTRAVSDVYQDLFHEGSFIGKGIYEVDAFERALAGRFPENAVLSHDLLESVHARCGLVSDVTLYEEYPTGYDTDAGRRRRWIRGDWQITPWLLPWVPAAEGRRLTNPLSGLSWWKIFDNLRRSLVPVALLLFLIGCALFVRPIGNLAALLVVAIVFLPGLLPLLVELLRKPPPVSWAMHLREVRISAGRALGQIALTLAFLPYEAALSLDAIGRTLVRLLVTRRRLLEWKTSREVAARARADLPGFYRKMKSAPVVALTSAALLAWLRPGELGPLVPFLVLWLAAPAIGWWISQPLEVASAELGPEQLLFLRRIARKTWHFFETFVNAEENWLPPDNFQEESGVGVATRTSPTNIGLALLANLAARDFGYLSLGRLLDRTEATIATLARLERHRGHFYNWYETRTLKPLLPLYVSSVDSGNLAGHLLTLGAGLRALADEPILHPQIFAGLRDALALVPGEEPLVRQLAAELKEEPADFRDAAARLDRAEALAAPLTSDWGKIFARNCAEHAAELRLLIPADPERTPTLRELAETNATAEEWLHRLEEVARQAEELASMDFTFLFDSTRDLFSIGYNVTEGRRDLSYYDLLASEARLCSYVAIAQGQVPQDHWFALGRLLVAPHGEPVLVSWSGSMFEYLMPMLVMPSYENTLLDHTCRSAVAQQIEYGRARGVPWGISESGYYQTDLRNNYQYRAFGVPGLGLKRGLSADLVIAPYATVMALMVAPREACENLQRLTSEGREGAYGFYEAVDYTPSRLPPDEKSETVRSFMAHHQGMGFLALDYLLHGLPMQRRFMSRPLFKAADLLLQERVPKAEANVLPEDLALEESRPEFGEDENVMRVFKNPSARAPEVHLLSNGRYHVAISSAGGGYSRWNDLAVTRWREDATRDCWGTFIYLRDLTSGEFWSAAFQPTLRPVENYEAIFTQARAEFRERHNRLELHTEICVSPEDDVELRRVTLTNHAATTRVIELTSYAEVVLATQAADEAHPAFSNLFVQTEFAPASSALLCTRRARSEDEKPPWLLHLLVGQGGEQSEISCETDRSKFIGRGASLTNPAAMRRAALEQRGVGPRPNRFPAPHGDFAAGRNRGARFRHWRHGRPRRRARARGKIPELAHGGPRVRPRLDAQPGDASPAQRDRRRSAALCAARRRDHLCGPGPARDRGRAPRQPTRPERALELTAFPATRPLVLLRISDTERIEIVRQLVQAHSYWRAEGPGGRAGHPERRRLGLSPVVCRTRSPA